MSLHHRHFRIALVGLSCAALGAGASAIASAGAATGASAKAKPGAHAQGGHGALRLARRAVHADLVVATKHGFQTVTIDRGKVDSVNGQQLTLTEGTKQQTYKTVTFTIPANAKVRNERQNASLSSLHSGERAIIVQAPQHTFVIARTPRRG